MRACLVARGLAVALVLLAARSDAAERVVDYGRDVRPILANTCYQCHGPDPEYREAGLRLDRKESALGKLESGQTAIVPGQSAKSELVRRIRAKDPAEIMPPGDSGKSLTPAQIETLTRWIDEGAAWGEHWAFARLLRPALPVVPSLKRQHNPIDVFIAARLEKEGFALSPEADRPTLVRRVTLDLTGLPPTPAEVDRFLADTAADAYQRLVDRLLDSPRYGEQMARYWLDAARYGDTHGLHLDNERAIWPYRDWVIEAFNRNLPFDQFTIEQLAGDLLPSPTRQQRVATGFNRCNVSTSEGGAIDEEFRVRYAVDRTSTVGTVWMGLTVGCATCHDHKFDPITQKEFYGLYAFFNSTADAPMDGNALLPPPVLRLPSADEDAKQKALEAKAAGLRERIKGELAKVRYTEPPTGAPASESQATWEKEARAGGEKSLPDPIRKALAVEPGKRSPADRGLLRDYYLENIHGKTRPIFPPLRKELAETEKELSALAASIPATMVTEELPKPREAFVLKRGEYDKPGEKVGRGVPAVLPPLAKEAPRNRLGLARWLVDPAHPLTARVTVNRFWQQYFGTGLVKTSEDFGIQGEQPSHPELLDWLASEFVSSKWNVKSLQKLIVTSATYRQSSRATPALLKRDPENRLLARGPRFRMDAEMVRDNALAVSGLLAGRIGGRGVKPYQPAGLWEAISYPTSSTAKFVQDHGEALYRRSLYLFWKRTSPPPLMTLLDAPSRETCTVRRPRTNTPVAALALMNETLFVESARHLGQRMMVEGGAAPDQRIRFGFRLATARFPQPEETAALVGQYQRHLAEFQRDPASAVKLLTVGESPRNGSLDAAQHAAWTLVANALLNLDEVLSKE